VKKSLITNPSRYNTDTKKIYEYRQNEPSALSKKAGSKTNRSQGLLNGKAKQLFRVSSNEEERAVRRLGIEILGSC
jgi:hypothetical protein